MQTHLRPRGLGLAAFDCLPDPTVLGNVLVQETYVVAERGSGEIPGKAPVRLRDDRPKPLVMSRLEHDSWNTVLAWDQFPSARSWLLIATGTTFHGLRNRVAEHPAAVAATAVIEWLEPCGPVLKLEVDVRRPSECQIAVEAVTRE